MDEDKAVESNESLEIVSSELPVISASSSKAEEEVNKQNNGTQNLCNDNDSDVIKRLNRELALSTTHQNEIESHWRQVLRKEKFNELHDDIEPLAKYHEQNVTRKQEVIQASQNEFDHLQELYRKAMVSNMFRMGELITIHDDQVILLESAFRERVESLQKEFVCDVANINANYEAKQESVRVTIKKQQQKDEYMTELINQATQNQLEEIKNRNLEDVNSLRFALDSKMEDLEEQFEQANFDYAQSTDFTKAAYEQLKAKDTQMRKEVQKKTRHADRLQSEIQRFQLIAKQEGAQNRERHQALLERKTRAIQKFQMTKDEMVKFRKDQQQRLVMLTRRANEKKEALKQQRALAERVKKIAMSCHKWETSREQFASLLRDCTSNQDDTCAIQSDKYHTKRSDMHHMSRQSILLQNNAHRFWDKYNMTQLDVETLEKRE